MSQHLQFLIAELAKDFGKTACWRVLCQEQNATTEAAQIQLAEQVLAEPPMDTVGGRLFAMGPTARREGSARPAVQAHRFLTK